MSAFTIAFQVPNLVRRLFADAAIQAAFVPVFTEQLEKGNNREAFRLASTLLSSSPWSSARSPRSSSCSRRWSCRSSRPASRRDPRPHGHPLADPLPDPDPARGQRDGRRDPQQLRPLRRLRDLAVLLERGDHRRPRRRWRPRSTGNDRIYAYAIGVLVGTVVQLLIPALDLRNTPFRFSLELRLAQPDVRRVLLLMLPVTISLGLINFNLLINSLFGSLVSDEAPAAIDKAFRIYQLPQGIFSVAIATVLFPTLARFAARGEHDNLRATMANGMRQILFVLLPAAAAVLVLSEPMIRLVYQRGEFTPAQTDAGRDGALLVRLLAAHQRPLPAAHPDLLQPPAALGADRDRRRQPRRHRARRRSPSTTFGVGGIVAATRSRPPPAWSPSA